MTDADTCQNSTCRCAAALADLLGHTPTGHRILHILWNGHRTASPGLPLDSRPIRTPNALALLTDDDLQCYRGLGTDLIQEIRTRQNRQQADLSTTNCPPGLACHRAPELARLLGHDHRGHLAVHRLTRGLRKDGERQPVVSIERLLDLDEHALQEYRGIGPCLAYIIRDRVLEAAKHCSKTARRGAVAVLRCDRPAHHGPEHHDRELGVTWAFPVLSELQGCAYPHT